jgi:hypothetical protein
VTLDPQRRQALEMARLRALVADHTGRPVTADASPLGAGAVLSDGSELWASISSHTGLGPVVAHASRRRSTAAHVVVVDPGGSDAAGIVARRAAQFRVPVTVWCAEGRRLRPIAAVAPTPLMEVSVPHDLHRLLTCTIEHAGVDVVYEHGVVRGEVEGLEVCRIIVNIDDAEARLEVGVGTHDREAFQLMHADRPVHDALAQIATLVRTHRRADAPTHPLNQWAPERLVLARLRRDPALIGADSIVTLTPPVPRGGVKERAPAVARAVIDGEDTMVVCSAGVDLDLVPFAADARVSAGRADMALLIVVPTRDRVSVTVELATQLRVSATVVGI